MDNQNEMDINLGDLFFFLRRRILIILAVAVACAAVGFLGTKLLIAEQYTASTRVYVLNRSNETTVLYSDYQISSEMLGDYKVLITGRNVTKEVVERLELDMHYSDLAKKIAVTSPDDTRFVQINVTDSDPERAANIANLVREIASVQIRELMDVDAVNLVFAAEVPEKPSAPNTMMNAVLAAGVGVVVILAVLVIVYVMDDSIKTEEDVARYLNLGVVGVIPSTEELAVFNKKKSGNGKKSRRNDGKKE